MFETTLVPVVGPVNTHVKVLIGTLSFTAMLDLQLSNRYGISSPRMHLALQMPHSLTDSANASISAAGFRHIQGVG